MTFQSIHLFPFSHALLSLLRCHQHVSLTVPMNSTRGGNFSSTNVRQIQHAIDMKYKKTRPYTGNVELRSLPSCVSKRDGGNTANLSASNAAFQGLLAMPSAV